MTLNGTGGADFDFGLVNEGTYVVETEDVRSDITVASGETEVSDVTGETSFSDQVYTDQRGDVVNVTVDSFVVEAEETPGGETETPVEEEALTEEETPTEEDTLGFGVVAAGVTLIAAALLAIRRD